MLRSLSTDTITHTTNQPDKETTSTPPCYIVHIHLKSTYKFYWCGYLKLGKGDKHSLIFWVNFMNTPVNILLSIITICVRITPWLSNCLGSGTISPDLYVCYFVDQLIYCYVSHHVCCFCIQNYNGNPVCYTSHCLDRCIEGDCCLW